MTVPEAGLVPHADGPARELVDRGHDGFAVILLDFVATSQRTLVTMSWIMTASLAGRACRKVPAAVRASGPAMPTGFERERDAEVNPFADSRIRIGCAGQPSASRTVARSLSSSNAACTRRRCTGRANSASSIWPATVAVAATVALATLLATTHRTLTTPAAEAAAT
ncbi:hypothetical protein [Frankia gtarii]|uniref:hypothetical protein n=1 Tax=Frankia gtarii TaxID=2950102 RepID=UPI0021C1CBCB|nr:hypothetical protein [Frankia gtarii]